MSLKDKEKLESTTSLKTSEPTCAPEKAAESHAHDYGHHKPLLAERIFDVSLYGVWNYGIQVGASVLAGMWFKEGGGKPYFDKAAEWMGKNVMSKITNKTGAAAAKESHTWLIFAALITVGNLFIPPIQYIECRKDKVVGKINDWLNARRAANGNPPSEQELKDQQETIAAIAAEPRQTPASLWGGRIVGLAANFLAAHLVGRDRNIAMENATAETVSKGLNAVGLTNLAKSENVKNFSRIAFLDYGYSLISANVVYLYSHFIHPPKYTNQKDTQAAPCAPSLSSPPPQAGEGNGAYAKGVSAVGGGTFPPAPPASGGDQFKVAPRKRGELATPKPELLAGSTIHKSELTHDASLAV